MTKTTKVRIRPTRPPVVSELGKLLEKRADLLEKRIELKEATLKKLIEKKKANENIF
jgi:hypothetical protein